MQKPLDQEFEGGRLLWRRDYARDLLECCQRESEGAGGLCRVNLHVNYVGDRQHGVHDGGKVWRQLARLETGDGNLAPRHRPLIRSYIGFLRVKRSQDFLLFARRHIKVVECARKHG